MFFFGTAELIDIMQLSEIEILFLRRHKEEALGSLLKCPQWLWREGSAQVGSLKLNWI